MQSVTQETMGEEVSLKVMINFFRRNWKWLVMCVLTGLLYSVVKIATTPASYEARWQLQMAQIFINSKTDNSGIINVVNIEESAALIHRLGLPTLYPLEVRAACGLQETMEVIGYLDGLLKAEEIKQAPNAVAMKVRATSPEQAKSCAEAVVGMIVAQQRGLIEDRLAGRQAQITEYQRALREEQKQLETIKKSELVNFGYLAKLDKLSWLRTRIDEIQEEIILSQKHPAHLAAPIFVSSKPVSSKAVLQLILGVSFGLMFGVLFALGRDAWRRATS